MLRARVQHDERSRAGEVHLPASAPSPRSEPLAALHQFEHDIAEIRVRVGELPAARRARAAATADSPSVASIGTREPARVRMPPPSAEGSACRAARASSAADPPPARKTSAANAAKICLGFFFAGSKRRLVLVAATASSSRPSRAVGRAIVFIFGLARSSDFSVVLLRHRSALPTLRRSCTAATSPSARSARVGELRRRGSRRPSRRCARASSADSRACACSAATSASCDLREWLRGRHRRARAANEQPSPSPSPAGFTRWIDAGAEQNICLGLRPGRRAETLRKLREPRAARCARLGQPVIRGNRARSKTTRDRIMPILDQVKTKVGLHASVVGQIRGRRRRRLRGGGGDARWRAATVADASPTTRRTTSSSDDEAARARWRSAQVRRGGLKSRGLWGAVSRGTRRVASPRLTGGSEIRNGSWDYGREPFDKPKQPSRLGRGDAGGPPLATAAQCGSPRRAYFGKVLRTSIYELHFGTAGRASAAASPRAARRERR